MVNKWETNSVMKRKILFISMCLPFDKAFHAGGKTFNYYINQFANDDDNEVTLIAKVLPEEEKYIDSINGNINLYTVATPKNKIKKIFSYVKSLNSKLNPFYKYGNVLTKEIYNQIFDRVLFMKKNSYQPDVVVLEWTSMLLFIDKIKKVFPNAVYVASEHDVSFLGYERKYYAAKKLFKRIYAKAAYDSLKKHEIDAINSCNLVVTHNNKDRELLIKNEINESKLGVITPYYDKFPSTKRTPQKGNIIFYGAMNRVENSSSAIWFIENVMPLLNDYDIHFTIIGNKPPRELLDRANEKITVTGFVDDPAPYFENAMCLVAPLLLGAGVKVKIIEGLSSGVPVITNAIGIEGIDAEDGKEYFFATSPEEYAEIIIKMMNGSIDLSEMSANAHKLIEEKYDLNKSYDNYSKRIYDLL